VRHQVIGFCLRQTLLDSALDADQTGAELVLGQFAHRADTTVAEVIDIIDITAPVAQFDQDTDHINDIARRQGQLLANFDVCTQRLELGCEGLGFRQRGVFDHGPRTEGQQADHVLNRGERLTGRLGQVFQGRFGLGCQPLDHHLVFDDVLTGQAAVELHAADAGQIVALVGVEQPVEQDFDRFFRRRLARAHHAVDGDPGSLAGGGFIGTQGVRDERAAIEFVGVQGFNGGNTGFTQLGEQGLGDFVVGVGDNFAGCLIDDVLGDHTTNQEFVRHSDLLDTSSTDITNMFGGNPLVLGNNQLAIRPDEVETGHFAAQTLRNQRELDLLLAEQEGVELEELLQNLLRGHADGLEQRGDRHLATAINPEEQGVLRIEFEIQPGTAVGNHTGREQQFARAMGLAPVMLEEDTRRAVQLGNDDPLGTIDHEGAIGRHQGDFTHVDFLLLDLLHGIRCFAIHDHQAYLGTQGRREGQATLVAFSHVKSGLAEHVADEFQTGIAGMRNDRKNRGERSLQAFVFPRLGRDFILQEVLEGLQLGRQQVRNVQHAGALGEALADAFLLGEGVSHGNSVRMKSNREPAETGKRKQTSLPRLREKRSVCVCRLAIVN